MTLEVNSPKEVRRPVARVTGHVTATNVKGNVIGARGVVSVFINSYFGRRVDVDADGRFSFRTRLKRVGKNKVTVVASWLEADADKEQTITITRRTGRNWAGANPKGSR